LDGADTALEARDAGVAETLGTKGGDADAAWGSDPEIVTSRAAAAFTVRPGRTPDAVTRPGVTLAGSASLLAPAGGADKEPIPRGGFGAAGRFAGSTWRAMEGRCGPGDDGFGLFPRYSAAPTSPVATAAPPMIAGTTHRLRTPGVASRGRTEMGGKLMGVIAGLEWLIPE